MALPANPIRHHERRHHGEFVGCWYCQRSYAICRTKRLYITWQAADRAVLELNETRAYVSPVTHYRCRWCLCWHVKTCRDKTELRRAEQQRRKWLINKRAKENAA